jgi:hypothetical protein
MLFDLNDSEEASEDQPAVRSRSELKQQRQLAKMVAETLTPAMEAAVTKAVIQAVSGLNSMTTLSYKKLMFIERSVKTMLASQLFDVEPPEAVRPVEEPSLNGHLLQNMDENSGEDS